METRSDDNNYRLLENILALLNNLTANITRLIPYINALVTWSLLIIPANALHLLRVLYISLSLCNAMLRSWLTQWIGRLK